MLKAAIARIERSFTIATTPRTGSNHLCDLLTQAGLGQPTEHFQYSQPIFDTEDLEGILSTVLRDNTVNGTFGSKMSHDHRAWVENAFTKLLGRGVLLEDVLPCHYWIRFIRNDRVGQAVSFFKAMQTQQWLLLEGAEDTEPKPKVPYDFEGILSSYKDIAAAELAWDVYLSSSPLRHEPLEVTYEDLELDPGAVLRSIANFVSVSDWKEPGALYPRFRLQRDDNSRELANRFVYDLKRRWG